MKLGFKDIYIRPLKVSDINIRYINWFSDPNVTEFLEARNITIEDSKSYLINGYKTGQYYIYAICLDKKDLHIGNIKIGPIKSVTTIGRPGLNLALDRHVRNAKEMQSCRYNPGNNSSQPTAHCITGNRGSDRQ